MNANTRQTLLEIGIALDAVVIATGLAYLAPTQPLIVFGALLGAVALAAWLRGAVSGLAAAMISVIALVVSFETLLDARRIISFGVTAAAVCIAVEVIRWSSGAAAASASELPAAESGRRSTLILEALTSLALPLLVFVLYSNFSDIAMRNFGIPSMLQPLILILGVAIWHYRKHFGTADVALQPLTLALAAYCVVLFVSSIWAADVRLADERIVDGVKNLAIFLIIATLAASWRALKTSLVVLTIAAAALSLITMFQSLAHDWTHEFFGFARIQIATLYGDVVELRPAGPVGDPNFYAQFLLMIVPLALFTAFAVTRPLHRTLLLIAAAIITGGTLLTYSRGAMVALALVVVLTLVALQIRAKQIAATAAVAILTIVLLPGEVMRRLVTMEALVPGASTEVDSSILKRQLLLGTAFRMFDDHLLLGVGAGNFTRFFPLYASEVGSSGPQYDEPGERMFPHTLYLEIGAETGLLGLLTFGAAIAIAFASLLRARQTLLARGDTAHAGLATGLAISLTAYLVTSLFLHGSFQRYLFLLFALIAAATRMVEDRQSCLSGQAGLPALHAEATP